MVPIPFYMIGVDIIGPLKTTDRGNIYILSVVDYCTKYAEAVALPNQEAVQGSNFESEVITSLCGMFEIEKRRTTAYHPHKEWVM